MQARVKYAAQSGATAHRKDVVATYDGVLARVGLFAVSLAKARGLEQTMVVFDCQAHELVGCDSGS